MPKAEIPTGYYKLPQTSVASGASIVWPKFSDEVDADACLAIVIGKTGRRVPLRATDHMEEELTTALRANPPRLGDGVIGRAAVSREPVQVPNILEERAYAPRMRQLLERFGFRASLAVPLVSRGLDHRRFSLRREPSKSRTLRD